MNFENATATPEAARQLPPRERIVAAARELFYRQGIRAVGVEAIAEAAGTNKMTLYRHFPSKDALVAECMRQFAQRADAFWAKLDAAHAGDPRGQLHAWLKAMGENVIDAKERGCALANAAVELADKDHPARKVIEEFKRAQRDRLIRLCQATGIAQPELLAEELFLLIEGARMCQQSIGPEGPGARFVRMGEAIIASHAQ